MNLQLLPMGVATATNQAGISTGEQWLFWIVAPIMVLAALGLLFVKNAVHGALLMVTTMVGLAVMYAAQDAPFLFAAQIVVYTGAVMMLFLFVLMLVGVDARENVKETIAGQRLASILGGVGLAVLLVSTVVGMNVGPLQWEGLGTLPAAPGTGTSNPLDVARVVFGQFPFALEIVATLLITAAVGAIMLTHRERLAPPRTQRSLSEQRIRSGTAAPLPGPGVFARHNAVDTPALLPDGTPSELSISRVMRARGQEAGEDQIERLTGATTRVRSEIESRRADDDAWRMPDSREGNGS